MKKLEYETHNGEAFSIWFNEKQNKVIGFEYETEEVRSKTITLEAISFVSYAQYKATLNRLINCKLIE